VQLGNPPHINAEIQRLRSHLDNALNLVDLPISPIPLPPSWDVTDEKGNIYYRNIQTNLKTKRDPRRSPPPPLPAGYEMRISNSGREYFFDHNTKRTTYVDPRKGPREGSLDYDLPCGWEVRAADSGRLYFLNHVARSTTWADPRDNFPPGWERRKTKGGRSYFVDHNTGTTTWSDPRNAAATDAHAPKSSVFARATYQDYEALVILAFALRARYYITDCQPDLGDSTHYRHLANRILMSDTFTNSVRACGVKLRERVRKAVLELIST